MCGSHDRPSVYKNRKYIAAMALLCSMCWLTIAMMVCWSRTHDIRSFSLHTHARSRTRYQRERNHTHIGRRYFRYLSVRQLFVCVCEWVFFFSRRFQRTYMFFIVVVVVVVSSALFYVHTHTRFNVYVSIKKSSCSLSFSHWVLTAHVWACTLTILCIYLFICVHAISSKRESTQICKLF